MPARVTAEVTNGTSPLMMTYCIAAASLWMR
jgi:hypothetical protein